MASDLRFFKKLLNEFRILGPGNGPRFELD
jgi:hypothetical protein